MRQIYSCTLPFLIIINVGFDSTLKVRVDNKYYNLIFQIKHQIQMLQTVASQSSLPGGQELKTSTNAMSNYKRLDVLGEGAYGVVYKA